MPDVREKTFELSWVQTRPTRFESVCFIQYFMAGWLLGQNQVSKLLRCHLD